MNARAFMGNLNASPWCLFPMLHMTWLVRLRRCKAKRVRGWGGLHIKPQAWRKQVGQIQNAGRFPHPALWPLDKSSIGIANNPSLIREQQLPVGSKWLYCYINPTSSRTANAHKCSVFLTGVSLRPSGGEGRNTGHTLTSPPCLLNYSLARSNCLPCLTLLSSSIS